MTHVSHSLVESVWQKVGSNSTDQISAMQKRHQKDQKTLSKFANSHLLKLREDAAGSDFMYFM